MGGKIKKGFVKVHAIHQCTFKMINTLSDLLSICYITTMTKCKGFAERSSIDDVFTVVLVVVLQGHAVSGDDIKRSVIRCRSAEGVTVSNDRGQTQQWGQPEWRQPEGAPSQCPASLSQGHVVPQHYLNAVFFILFF